MNENSVEKSTPRRSTKKTKLVHNDANHDRKISKEVDVIGGDSSPESEEDSDNSGSGSSSADIDSDEAPTPNTVMPSVGAI